ncbi:MAG: S-layer homology domain-containing protein, partial [Clostridia bacterium]|nr:S-layer homology domain-containing protein [Clostridia bacterium]
KYIAFCKSEEEAKAFVPTATGSAVLTAEKADSVVSDAAKNDAKYIYVSFAGTPGSTNGNITLSKEFISGADSKLKNTSVNVISDEVKITLDSAVIKELAALSSDVEFAFIKDGDGIKISALSNGKEIKLKNNVRVLIYASTGDTTVVATVNGNAVVDSGVITARPVLKTALPATVGYKTHAYTEFTDTAGHWGNSYIKFVSARSLFNGVTQTEFAPNGTMTRAMAATVLMRLAESDAAVSDHPYTDVAKDAWYNKAVGWAYANKISDTQSDKFRPDEPITREELASFLYNFANDGKAGTSSSFTDTASITAAYKDAVDYCVEKKIINGYDDGSFMPQNKASRAEVSTMITRFINSQLKANEIDILDYQNVDFDENNIVLTFLSVSDIHIDSASFNGAAKNYKNAVDNAYKLAKSGDLDLVFAAGDLVQNLCYEGDYTHELHAFKQHTDNFLRGDTALVYCTGNHDRMSSVHFEKEFIDAFTATDADKERYFRFDVEDPDPDTGNRHAVVNGYHFLIVGMYQDYTSYLKPRLDEITAAEPDKPVFVQYHYHANDTVYATKASKNSGETKLKELLDNYPQVIFFSGHTHNGLDNPRAIWQDTFTALDTAAVRYLDDNSLINWEFKIPANATHNEVFEYASEATLVEVDANNNVRFKAYNTYRGDIVNEFTISAPNSDNTHLLTYTDDREAYSMPPEFSADAKLHLTKNAGGTCRVVFDQATHDDIVWYYSLTFEADGEKITKYLTSRYYDPNGMPDTLNVTVAGLTVGKNYTVTLTPYDVWDHAGEPIVKEYVA